MKYEWRKKEKELYLPKNEPTLIDVPTMNYLTMSGKGNPNEEDFSVSVQCLYAMSYGIRMLPKKGIVPEGYYDYTVFPLEGVWSLDEEGILLQQEGADLLTLKDHFLYKVMIRQPDFVDEALFNDVMATVAQKKKGLPIRQVIFETINEGRGVQMMHLGSYDSEPVSFAQMEAFAVEQGLTRMDKTHKEIYLTDPNKTAPEKQKTTLRFWVV